MQSGRDECDERMCSSKVVQSIQRPRSFVLIIQGAVERSSSLKYRALTMNGE